MHYHQTITARCSENKQKTKTGWIKENRKIKILPVPQLQFIETWLMIMKLHTPKVVFKKKPWPFEKTLMQTALYAFTGPIL